MGANELRGELLPFIREHIRSVWALELLLVVRRVPDRVWTSQELVGELRASSAVVTKVVSDFARSGLLQPENAHGWRYGRTEVLNSLCDALAEAYRERPVSVVNAIMQRGSSVQQLADAFRLKRDDQ